MSDENLIAEGTSSPLLVPACDNGPAEDLGPQPRPWWPGQHLPSELQAAHQEEVGTTPVDAIAHSLRRQHLQPDAHFPPPISRPPAFAHYTHASYPGSSSSALEVDPMYLDPPTTAPSCIEPLEPTAHATTAATLPRRGAEPATAGHAARQESSRLRRKYSTNFSDNISSSQAKQTLVESMIRSGEQCQIRNPPVLAPTGATATPLAMRPNGECPLVPDKNATSNAPYDDSPIENFVNQSRLSGSTALERNGFPLYRTSREVALRSQNLVRNKPRMRKRPKLREKPSMSAIPAASGSTTASSSTPSN